jgi:hypothetical protein
MIFVQILKNLGRKNFSLQVSENGNRSQDLISYRRK